jgi:chemotaxis protein methyltransferase CheR
MGLHLSNEVFTILTALIEQHAGLHYKLADKDLIADRVSARAEERGFDSLLDYYYFLRYDPGAGEELDALVEALAVGETYFFREVRQLEYVVEHVVTPAVIDGRRPRVWTAACSTGEEPLSLAMLLRDRGLCAKVDLVASDVSRRSLDTARRGVFGQRSARALGPDLRPGISPVDPATASSPRDRVCVDRDLVDAIDWRRVNLLDAEAVAALGGFDAVLCRNVLIYFTDEVASRVVRSLAGNLREEGVLLVGVSESLLRFSSDVACEEHHGVFVYRRGRS